MRPTFPTQWLFFLSAVYVTSLHPTNAFGKLLVQRAASYKQAAQQITTELETSLKTATTHVVWLVDESPSMRDDAHEFSQLVVGIHDSLKPKPKGFHARSRSPEVSVKPKPKGFHARSRSPEVSVKPKPSSFELTHSVASFGKSLHLLTKRPTSDLNEVRQAIARIPIDETGQENLYLAVGKLATQFGRLAVRAKQKLVIVVLTDESSSDGQQLEQCIAVCNRSSVQVHIAGRMAMFATGKAYHVWKHPVSRMSYWLQTDRGPSSVLPEIVSYQGIGRALSIADAFTPYGQTRLVSETNGTFIALPDGTKSPTYDTALLSQYSPQLQSLQEQIKQTKSSPFRSGLIAVVSTLNATKDKRLAIAQVYSFDAEERNNQHIKNAERIQVSLAILDKAITALEKLRPSRAKERNARWQANYDLSYAQCLAARLRLIHTLVQLSRIDSLKPVNEKSNRWTVSTTPKIAALKPGEASLVGNTMKWEIKLNSVNFALDELAKEAKAAFEYVKKEYPETPWAYYAAAAIRQGFGIQIRDTFQPPQPKVVIKPPVL